MEKFVKALQKQQSKDKSGAKTEDKPSNTETKDKEDDMALD